MLDIFFARLFKKGESSSRAPVSSKYSGGDLSRLFFFKPTFSTSNVSYLNDPLNFGSKLKTYIGIVAVVIWVSVC